MRRHTLVLSMIFSLLVPAAFAEKVQVQAATEEDVSAWDTDLGSALKGATRNSPGVPAVRIGQDTIGSEIHGEAAMVSRDSQVRTPTPAEAATRTRQPPQPVSKLPKPVSPTPVKPPPASNKPNH